MDGFTCDLGQVADRILCWAAGKLRVYPWRFERDPYKVLVAEMLLQRTKAEQVVKIYGEFLRRYPDPHSLSRADLGEVERLLHPLGLRWRARKIWEMARVLVEKYGGKMPLKREMLAGLPGVGDYAAGAVLCFALGRDEPLTDSNIARVIVRLLDLKIRGEPRRDKRVWSAVLEIHRNVPAERRREFYWGLLDFAASVCTPRNPDCPRCPLLDLCASSHKIEK